MYSSKKTFTQSVSYVKFKKQTQDTFDFSVLVCSAVPVLKRNIILFEKGVINEITKADYYQPKGDISSEKQKNINTDLKRRAQGYKNKLCKYTLLSNFSFFESFIYEIISELISFHGGIDELINKSKCRTLKNINSDDSSVEKNRRRLRKIYDVKGHAIGVCKTATNNLKRGDYRFPSEMFSAFGLRVISEKNSNIKSFEIPDFLTNGFAFELNDDSVETFHNIRELRNKIAHGDTVNLDLTDITEKCKFLSSLAKDFDQHLSKHFFISEKFV